MEDFACSAKIGESLLCEEPFQNLTVKTTGLALADLAFLCRANGDTQHAVDSTE